MGINELLPTLSKSQKDPYQQQKSIHNKTSLALICDAVSDASSSSKRGQQSYVHIDYEEQHAIADTTIITDTTKSNIYLCMLQGGNCIGICPNHFYFKIFHQCCSSVSVLVVKPHSRKLLRIVKKSEGSLF